MGPPTDGRDQGDTFALAILTAVALGVLCAWLAGCSPRRLPVEVPAPSAERMAALLAAPAAAPVAVRPAGDVTLTVVPRVVLWGGGVRLRCLVIDAPDVVGAVRLALEGVTVTIQELPNQIEHSVLIERLQCGKWLATCTVVRRGRPIVIRQDDVEVRGGLCDGTR